MADDVQARLLEHAARDARAPFLLAPGASPMSYGSLADHVEHVRASFGAWGIARGDIVVASEFDRPQAAALLAAAPVASAFCLLSDALNEAAYAELLTRLRARAVLAPSEDHPLARAARRHGIARIAIEARGDEAGAFRLRLVDAGRTLDGSPPLHPREWAHVCVTSGTTDRPKIVPYRQRAELAVGDALGARLHVTSDDVSAAVTPLPLTNGQRCTLLLPALHGAAALCLPNADADALLDAIRADRVSFVFVSFAILRAVLERLGPRDRIRSPRMRFIRVASGMLDREEVEALEEAFGVPAITGLAMTETGILTHQGLPPAPRTLGTLGRPLIAEIRIADDTGREVGTGEVGEVQARGPQVFDGYIDDEPLDRSTRVEGWFRVGDLARWDEGGNLVLVGRAKEMVNRGGEKLSPPEVDVSLRAIPGVADAAAFGVPHPTLGEELVAAVVREAGSRVSEVDVLAAAGERLGARRAPKRIWFVDAFPRNEAGKVLRRLLPAHVGYTAGSSTQASDVAAPRPAIEAALAGLWGAVLGIEDVRPDDRFRDLGGDDAQVATLFAQVRAVFGVELGPVTLDGEAGTLAGMARSVEAARHR